MKWIEINKQKPTELGLYAVRLRQLSMSGFKEINPKIVTSKKQGRFTGVGTDDIKVTHWCKLPEIVEKSEPTTEQQTSENATELIPVVSNNEERVLVCSYCKKEYMGNNYLNPICTKCFINLTQQTYY